MDLLMISKIDKIPQKQFSAQISAFCKHLKDFYLRAMYFYQTLKKIQCFQLQVCDKHQLI